MASQDPQGNVTRSLQLVAEARFDAFQANLPDLAVLGHIVEPMKVIKDWRPIGFLSIGPLLILVPSFEFIYLVFIQYM